MAFRAKRTVTSIEPRSRGRRKNAFGLDRKREMKWTLILGPGVKLENVGSV